MSDDDFSDDFDDELEQALNKPAVNRQVQETVIRRNEPAQRTLMGARVENEPAQYEEIRREITYGPTHHKTNALDMNTFIYPSNLDMRDYQYDIIVKSFYKNLLCAIPTGMGKTFIASTLMLNYYRWFKEGKIIFMAPTRPLVAQQIQACLGVTDIPSSDTAILLDKTRKNRQVIWNDKRVFFTTPQVVENDLKAGTLNPKEIVCLVIDEAHRARGNYAYTNVVKFIDRFNTSYRVLALTATPAADIEGVQEVVDNLHISQIEIRTEESIDIVKYMKRKETVRIKVGLNSEMEDIIELLSDAINPVLKQANEANIYDVTDPSKINAFLVMQKSQAVIKNPTLHEGIKWKYYFILQVIGYVGQMLRRLKIYGVRTFYSYYQNKCKEFRTKYSMGKSTNKTSAGFFYHDALKKIEVICDKVLADPSYVSHPKLEHMIDELMTFFQHKKNSRVIIFTELRESALEIVKCIDSVAGEECKAHIFIGQAKGKEGFDEEEFTRKHAPKGRGKQKKLEREEREREALEKKEQKKQLEAQQRAASRTGTSEEAQLQGMNQKTQKDLIKKFKKGEFNILVATSIGEEGLDIGEVDLIICYDSTSSPIKNIQRMGRTGRKNDGKVILLLASNEETKFDQAMEGYAFVQKQIAQDYLDMHKSDRIVPKEIQPKCVKQFIDIPEENLAIAKGEDEEQVIKYATQAMLGKTPKSKKTATKKTTKQGKILGVRNTVQAEKQQPKVTKKFFMPDNVEVGFVKSSKLVKKVGATGNKSNNSNNTSISLDSDEEESHTSAEKSKVNNKIIKEGKSFEKADLLDDLFSSSPTKPKQPSIANPTKPRTFFRPDVNAVEDPGRRIEQVEFSDSEAAAEHDNIKSADGDQNVMDEAQDELEIRSDSEDEFRRPMTPEYEKADFLASSPKENRDVDQSEVEEVEDSGSEKESIHSDDGEQDDTNNGIEVLRETQAKSITPQKRSSGTTMSGNKHPRVNNNEVLDSILSFKAFEQDNDNEVYSYVQPYEEAKKIMDKQYENDPAFSEDVSFETSESSKPKAKTAKTPKSKKNTKRVETPAEKSTGKKRKKAENVESNKPKVDITNLLRESSRKPAKSLGARRRKVDLSTIKKEQIIDLDDESDLGSQHDYPRKVIPNRRRQKSPEFPAYLSQKDRVVGNVFGKNDGFLTDDEKKEFFSEYYTSVEVNPLGPDPSLSARKLKTTAEIGHSRVGLRFINLIHMIRPPNSKSLARLIKQLDQNKNMRYKDEIRPSDVIVQEDKIEYVKGKTKQKAPEVSIEIDDESDDEESVLDTDRPGGVGFTSVSLLSDDDHEFKSL